MASTVRVKGGARLRRTLKKAGVDMANLRAANLRIGAIVKARAQAIAPRRSGKLASSVRPQASRARARVAAGSARVPYAGPIHWGWAKRNITAQPFLSEAGTQTEPAIIEAYLREIQQACDEVKGA